MNKPKVVVHKTDEELREDLKVAQEAYDRSNNYYNAVGIQKAKNQLAVRVQERRNSFKVVQGDGGSHDMSDAEVIYDALREIVRVTSNPTDIGGTLLHVYNVSKHALMATGRLSE